jgi:hypothetical protein
MPGDGQYEGTSNPPDGGNVSTPAPPPADSGARGQWLATAGDGSAKPATPAPGSTGAQQAPAATPGPLSQQPAPPKPPTAPVVTSTKRGGLLGVMDTVSDALAGKTRPEVGTDAQGNAYVKQHTLTHGEQWMRIAGEAMRGAAAGLAAGRGAGNMGKAAQAGIEAGDKSRKEEYSDVQQKVLDRANNQMLRMKMAEETWRQSRLKVEATQQDVKFWGDQQDRIEKAGGVFLGHAAHPGDISEIRTANPDVMKDLVQNPTSLEFIPQVDNTGVITGFAVYKVPEKYGSELLPAGTKFRTFDNINNKYEDHLTTKPMLRSEIDAYNTAAGNAAAKFRSDQTEEQLKGAQKKNVESEATARDKELPGKMNLTRAQASEANASAAEKRASTPTTPPLGGNQTPSGMPASTGNPQADEFLGRWPTAVQASVRGLAKYDTDPSTFPPRVNAKSGQMDRETAIGLARMIEPSFDEKLWKSRSQTLQDYQRPSGVGGAAITSLNQAIQHAGELNQAITNLDNSHFWLWNTGKNIWGKATDNPAVNSFNLNANGVVDELSNVFKKTGGTDTEIKQWRKEINDADGPVSQRASVTKAMKMINDRLHVIRRQFGAAMGSEYSDFPFVYPESEAAINSLGAGNILDFDKSKTRGAEQAAAQPITPNPGEQIFENPQTHVRAVLRNNKYLDVSNGQEVK